MTRNVLASCLVLSVVLNLVALGFFIGKRVEHVPIHTAFGEGAGISHVLKPLEEARRTEILQELRPRLGEMRNMYRDLATKQRRVRTAATSLNYDVEAFRASLGEFNEAHSKARRELNDVLAIAMSRLTAAERKAVFEKAMPASRIRAARDARLESRPRPARSDDSR